MLERTAARACVRKKALLCLSYPEVRWHMFFACFAGSLFHLFWPDGMTR